MISPDRSRDQDPPGGPAGAPARLSRTPPDSYALLGELWQISHFGWIAHATILRTPTISAGQHIAATALAERLQHLIDRGWAEQRTSAAHPGQREMRLTDSGRNALRSGTH